VKKRKKRRRRTGKGSPRKNSLAAVPPVFLFTPQLTYSIPISLDLHTIRGQLLYHSTFSGFITDTPFTRGGIEMKIGKYLRTFLLLVSAFLLHLFILSPVQATDDYALRLVRGVFFVIKKAPAVH
jgi:hypothetical protein